MQISEAQIHEFNKLYYKINGLYARFENAKNTNSSVYKVLHALFISELHTQKDIMQSYEMPKQTINNVIANLQKQGFIDILSSQNDKRERILNLTARGKEYARDYTSAYTTFEMKVYQSLGARNLSKLTQIYADFERLLMKFLMRSLAKRAKFAPLKKCVNLTLCEKKPLKQSIFDNQIPKT